MHNRRALAPTARPGKKCRFRIGFRMLPNIKPFGSSSFERSREASSRTFSTSVLDKLELALEPNG
jgi:hypothetical protein